MVHRREIDGQDIVFGNQGALWGNAMTWFDHDTGSIWSQPIGEAIAGPRTGETLELLPSRLTSWGDWLAEHPDSLALNSFNESSRFDLADMAVVVQIGSDIGGFRITDLRRDGVANAVLGDAPVAVVALPDTDDWAVFSRQLDDRVVELRLEGAELVELDGVGRWRALRGLSTTDDAQNLALLPGFTSFPRDYPTFFGDTGLVWVDGAVIPLREAN